MNKERNFKLDPRVSFALVIYLGTFSVYFRKVIPLLVLFVLSLFITFLMKIDLISVYKKIKRLYKSIIMVGILQGIFSPSGKVLFSIFNISIITTGGLTIALSTFFRMTILIIGGSILVMYPNRILIQGMIQLNIPFEIAYMVSIGIRFIPISQKSFQDSLVAIQLRGIDFDTLKLRERLDIYMYLLLPTIANGLQNAKELAIAMELRGFRSYDKRTSFFKLTFNKKDWFFLLCIFILFISTFLLGAFVL